ncbi:uncharacterized protein LOC119079656 [Bradysia coprophila]|uniref:uncharacterized protein LOC119079656 n=1 Tax=Bradysia coprophila TaxID=38358 RepID=UPI00187DB749|nr:uncharacterized protein LOC119079656 [Bradysia coprophila]
MHLQHKIPWKELVQCLRIDNTEISLPVGECGKIHLIDKATKIKVASRKFLTSDQICASSQCSDTTNIRSFSKNKLTEPILSRCSIRYNGWRKDKLKYINDKFAETVMEFVATEERKFSSLIHYAENEIVPESELLHTICTECRYQPCKYGCTDFLVFSLYSNYQIDKLLWLDSVGKVNIKASLSKTYGGQAVGNGYQFLVIYHLLPFYVRSNAIIACGYEADESKWGDLQPSASFRRSIEYDCDFLTFIPSLRPYLHKDVFMKDMNKTMELLRIVFRHIYVYIFLIKKFHCYYGDIEHIKHDLKMQWFFGFRDLDEYGN